MCLCCNIKSNKAGQQPGQTTGTCTVKETVVKSEIPAQPKTTTTKELKQDTFNFFSAHEFDWYKYNYSTFFLYTSLTDTNTMYWHDFCQCMHAYNHTNTKATSLLLSTSSQVCLPHNYVHVPFPAGITYLHMFFYSWRKAIVNNIAIKKYKNISLFKNSLKEGHLSTHHISADN